MQTEMLATTESRLKRIVWSKRKTATMRGISILLSVAPAATGPAIADDSNPKTGASTIFPFDVRQQLEKQRIAIQAVYFEFTEVSHGNLTNWDYAVAPSFSAYFDGNRFYQHEMDGPGFEQYEKEIAFDGQAIWQRDTGRTTRCSLADAPALLSPRFARWPYLDAAGIYAPQHVSEIDHFSSLEPLALHYLEHDEVTKVETVGGKLQVTFQVEDELAKVQKTGLESLRSARRGSTATKRKATVETPPNATRKVVLVLDPQHGYAVAQREDWSVAGQRFGSLRSDDWKFYDAAGIWLPGRCIASYYSRPRYFEGAVSQSPVHLVTNELRRIEFGQKNIPFTFGQLKLGDHIFDRTASSAITVMDVPEKVDLATVECIKAEVLEHSRVMDIASWLTDVYGPRVTGSPQTRAAAEWAVAKMQSWGISNAHLEPWGPFSRGWTSELFTFRAVSPQPFVINAIPAAWSPSTRGRITGPAIRFDVHSFDDMKRFAGRLKGAFLLIDPALPTPAHFEPQAARLSDARLGALAATEPLPRMNSNEVVELRFTDKILGDREARHWLTKQGIGAVVCAASGDGGTIFMWGHGGTGFNDRNEPDQLPIVKVSAECYGRIVRILQKDIPVMLELEMQNRFYDNPTVFNIIAEIPGTDPKLKEEVVMLGAHFDSRALATGATDNAAGSAMLMEAMRIIKALNLKPRRTIRIALWTGEEQGALGSKAYVAQHYRNKGGDSPDAKREYDNFSLYLNLDGGTGKIRGIFELGNTRPGPIFDAWMGPFKQMGMKTISPWDIGGGDDLSFKRVGLPSFGFIQDPIEYESRTHHSSADVYERLQSDDLQFNTAVLAAFAWQAAQRDERFPR